MIKHCNFCDSDQPVSNFNKKSTSKDKLSSRCKKCTKDYANAYYHADIKERKQRVKLYSKKALYRLREQVDKIRSSYGCSLCGEKDSCCLDFHHIIKNKVGTISFLVSRKAFDKLVVEINKCVVLCSNCHRKTHKHNIVISQDKICKITKMDLKQKVSRADTAPA